MGSLTFRANDWSHSGSFRHQALLQWHWHFSPFHHSRSWTRGVKLILAGGHISLAVAFKGPDVILGLCKWNYS